MQLVIEAVSPVFLEMKMAYVGQRCKCKTFLEGGSMLNHHAIHEIHWITLREMWEKGVWAADFGKAAMSGC